MQERENINEKITEERVLEGLAEIAFADDENVKPAERLKALELIGKHLGTFDGHGGRNSNFLDFGF